MPSTSGPNFCNLIHGPLFWSLCSLLSTACSHVSSLSAYKRKLEGNWLFHGWHLAGCCSSFVHLGTKFSWDLGPFLKFSTPYTITRTHTFQWPRTVWRLWEPCYNSAPTKANGREGQRGQRSIFSVFYNTV